MKSSHVWAIALIITLSIVIPTIWKGFNDQAKTNEIKALKEQVMHSIYIDSIRTRSVLDSLASIGKKLHDQDQRLEAYNKAERIRNIQTRKQNENLVNKIDSLRHLMDGRPEY